MNREITRESLIKSREEVAVALERWRRRDKRSILGWSTAFAILTFISIASTVLTLLAGVYWAAALNAGTTVLNLWNLHRNLVKVPEQDHKFYREMEGYLAQYDSMIRILDEEEKK